MPPFPTSVTILLPARGASEPIFWAAGELQRALHLRDVAATIGESAQGFTIAAALGDDGDAARAAEAASVALPRVAGSDGAAVDGGRPPRMGLRRARPRLRADRACRPRPPRRKRPVRTAAAARRKAVCAHPQHRAPVLLGGGGQELVSRPPVLARVSFHARRQPLQPLLAHPRHGLQLSLSQQLHQRRLLLFPLSVPARHARLRDRREGADAGGAGRQSRDA